MPQNDASFATFESQSAESFQRFRDPLEIASFGLNVITLQPRQRLRVHIHQQQEEVYVVLSGELTLTFEDETKTLRLGDLARVAPSTRRQLVNRGTEPVLLIAIGSSVEQEHERWDALAWTTWDEPGDGRHPQDVPLPEDLPAD